MKRNLIGIWGIAAGIVGTIWNVLGFACILHPGSAPGTKDWEEDRMFIPVGYIMIAVWLAAMVFSCYKLRKNKSDIIVFSITWLVGTAVCVFFMIMSP